MIWQNRPTFRPQIREYGCYYMSLIWLGAYKTGLPVDADMVNEKLYWRWLKKGWITETCYVMHPVAILQDMGVEVNHVSKEVNSYEVKDDELVIGQWKAWRDIAHFVVMDKGCVVYDPWWSKEGGSKAVRDGQLLSYRIFRR